MNTDSIKHLYKYCLGGAVAALLGLLPAGAAHAQTVNIVYTGTITSTDIPSVTTGSLFTISYSLNLNSANINSSPGDSMMGIYNFNTPGSATSTDIFGNYTYTEMDNSTVQIAYNTVNSDFGWELDSEQQSDDGLRSDDVVLFGDSPSLIGATYAQPPSFSSFSLNLILQQLPLSDFNSENQMNFIGPANVGGVRAC